MLTAILSLIYRIIIILLSLKSNITCDEINVCFSYKPVKLSALIEPLKLDFEALVRETFSDLDNKQFLENVEVYSLLTDVFYFCQ